MEIILCFNEWMNECLTPPQEENYTGYWMLDNGYVMSGIPN